MVIAHFVVALASLIMPKEEGSRYGAAPATKFTDAVLGSLVKPEQIVPAMHNLRATFGTEKTLSREWRMGQLKAFKKMLTEGRDELCEAMRVDLHKSPFEGFATELGLILCEIDTAMAHLDEWMKPTGMRRRLERAHLKLRVIS